MVNFGTWNPPAEALKILRVRHGITITKQQLGALALAGRFGSQVRRTEAGYFYSNKALRFYARKIHGRPGRPRKGQVPASLA